MIPASEQSTLAGGAEVSAVRDQVIAILRRDLKLGPDVRIDEHTPLLGGEYDLDSLDVLMLLTSIEKQFNIKIPSQEVRRDAFANVGTLARYIQERCG